MNANDNDSSADSGSFDRNELRRRFDDDLATIDVNIDQSRSRIHGFLQRFLRCKRIDDETAINTFNNIVAHSRNIIDNAGDKIVESRMTSTIPKLIHRVWLTDSANPAEPPQEYIQKMIDESRDYIDNGWQVWLWLREPGLTLNMIRRLQAANSTIILKDYNVDVLSGQPWEESFDRLLSARKFAFASDLLRMKLLYQYGGVYADMGARFRERRLMEFVADNFDYAFIFWETLFFQNSLMVMAPNSRIGQLYMEAANEPHSLPKSLFHALDGIEEGMAFSGLLITALLLFSNSENFRICPLAPNGEVVEWSSERSWYTRDADGSGKFGGAYIPESGASFLSKEGFEQGHPMPIFLP